MSTVSSIEWTDATWNPVTGCTKVSPGCKNCYAERLATRLEAMGNPRYQQGFDLTLHEDLTSLPLRWKSKKKIFVNSMSDLFHEGIPLRFIDRVFRTMRRATWHQFQVLTKRPERMAKYMEQRVERWGLVGDHIWLGTSVENQDHVDRAHVIASVPSAVRFLSCEPLLGPLDLSDVLGEHSVNWVIVGGESGYRARPMDREWVESIRLQCQRADVPFFFKQWGGFNKKRTGRLLDGRTWDQLPAVELCESR